ncbi:MAG: thioredoxin-disulfide reductase [Treponema sp.]|nr:thioredoxin-disulfide reductase [Treponema sp.]
MEYDADLLIIGAGPAGLTAAQYGARANLKVLVIEQLASGGQVLQIDVLENYPGNIVGRTGFELAQDMHRQAEDFGAFFLNETVSELKKEGKVFTAVMANGKKKIASAVIVATGAVHRQLDIHGEKEFAGRGVSYCATCDGAFFKNKKMFVVGGGDAACDDAQYLSRLTSQVVLVHRRGRFRAQKALAERVLHNQNIEVRFNTVIKEIKGEQKLSSVVLEHEGRSYEEAADAVFIFAGTVPNSALVQKGSAKADLDEGGYILTDQKMASSVAGLFAAGDVRSGNFRQVIVAAGEGAVAAHNAAEYIDELRGTAYQ